VIHTGVDVDTVAAGLGDDRIHVYGGTDTIAAGAGNDTLIVHFEGAPGAVSINSLSGNVDIGYSGNVSGFGAATFLGVENFHISSGNTNDIITTGGGVDIINAGGGDDIINAGGGNDTMTGGVGSDTFIFQAGSGHNTIMDFDSSDKLDISAFFSAEADWRFESSTSSTNTDSYAEYVGGTMVEGSHVSITLVGVDITTLSLDNFII
jgi:Ca2+-binding RTX toxin-like protein